MHQFIGCVSKNARYYSQRLFFLYFIYRPFDTQPLCYPPTQQRIIEMQLRKRFPNMFLMSGISSTMCPKDMSLPARLVVVDRTATYLRNHWAPFQRRQFCRLHPLQPHYPPRSTLTCSGRWRCYLSWFRLQAMGLRERPQGRTRPWWIRRS